jgi:uncharacterized protein YegL
MKTIPLFVAIDASGKTEGDVMKFFWEKFELMVEAFRQDPFALELLNIELSFFNRELIRVAPLTPIHELSTNDLKENFKGIKSTPRFLGQAALELFEVINEYEQSYIPKDVWTRPIVCFFVAGLPNDTLVFESSILYLQKKAEIFIFCCNENIRSQFSNRYPEARSRRWGELSKVKLDVNGAFEIFDINNASKSVLTYPLNVRFFS